MLVNPFPRRSDAHLAAEAGAPRRSDIASAPQSLPAMSDHRRGDQVSLPMESDRRMKSPGGTCPWGSVSGTRPELTPKRHVAANKRCR